MWAGIIINSPHPPIPPTHATRPSGPTAILHMYAFLKLLLKRDEVEMLYLCYSLLVCVSICIICSNALKESNPSEADCDWQWHEQPLSHFARGSTNGATFKQRLCVYSKYWKPDGPIFFYTGNESPVEEYVNNSGLQWTLAKEQNALLIFAEHRYFGESIPAIEGTENCLAYLSSEEALADYATLINHIKREWSDGVYENSAVIAFGGSYGGMLSSWLRILYPSAIDGAIAASAPVLGFPLDNVPLDSSMRSVLYAASTNGGSNKYCANNLKMAWVLLTDIGNSADGRAKLSDGMNLCTPLENSQDVKTLRTYLQSPLFDLAEGSYPFETDYITFALTGTNDPLPAWAMTQVCEIITDSVTRDSGDGDNKEEKDGTSYGIRLEGNPETVKFSVHASASTSDDDNDVVVINVDWDNLSNNSYTIDDVVSRTSIMQLLRNTAQSMQVWYNVTGTLPSCIDWSGGPAPSVNISDRKGGPMLSRATRAPSASSHTNTNTTHRQEVSADAEASSESDNICTQTQSDITVAVAWTALVCNEGMNLVNTFAAGIGNDLYWPPTLPKDYTYKSSVAGSLAFCSYFAQTGLYGIPTERDEWSFWLNTAYGGDRLQYASNIFYTNGNLDPWSGAGVLPLSSSAETERDERGVDDSIVSRVIDMGGHHLDLFWATDADPESVRQVREEQKQHIEKWVRQKNVQTTKKK